MKIFTKARVSNITASTVILFSLYTISSVELDSIKIGILAGLIGFASKHLFDTSLANND